MVWASHPMRCNRVRQHSSSLRHSVMSINQVETCRCDLSQDYRPRQVGRLDSGVIEPIAAPVIRDLGELDDLHGESFWVGRDKRNEARDVELEDAVGVELVARLGCTGLKLWIAPKLAGLLRWSGSRTRSHASAHGNTRPPAKSGTKTGTNCYFRPGTNGVRELKKSNEINGRGEGTCAVPALLVRVRVR